MTANDDRERELQEIDRRLAGDLPPDDASDFQQIEHSDDDDSNDRIPAKPAHRTPVKDRRLTSAISWVAGVAAILAATGIGSLVTISISTARKVDVLLDRPVPVPMSQYSSDREQTAKSLKTIEDRVTAIEQRQIDTLMRYER